MKAILIVSAFLLCWTTASSQVTMEHPALPVKQAHFEASSVILSSSKSVSEIQVPDNPRVSFALPKSKHNPFFCALEDKMYKANGVMFKFRLGSVQYVDALEGKSHYQAVPNSQTTARQLAVKRH